MKALALAALLGVSLAACGGSDAPVDPPQTTKLAFIGNSISLAGGAPGLDWDHTGGMAASDAAHDYVHLVSCPVSFWH